jgi:sodium/potassium-transporting ATPase subunit alpha
MHVHLECKPNGLFNIRHCDGQVETMTEAHQKDFQKSYELMASKGHRVIGCAKMLLNGAAYPDGFIFKKEVDEKKSTSPVSPNAAREGVYPQTGYTFMGLVSLEDPPKHGVREAIGQCRQAGIKVMMVTGDHPLTAEVSFFYSSFDCLFF